MNLNQSNNFKTLSISATTLKQMQQTKQHFVKYSRAHKLEFTFFDDPHLAYAELVLQLKSQLKNAGFCKNCDGWVEQLFKSIKILDLCYYGVIIADKLPLELLFLIKLNPNWNRLFLFLLGMDLVQSICISM